MECNVLATCCPCITNRKKSNKAAPLHVNQVSRFQREFLWEMPSQPISHAQCPATVDGVKARDTCTICQTVYVKQLNHI